jgi:hypothetical protein
MFAFSFSTPRPPRHPLLRAGLAVAGLVLLGFFAAFGVLIAALVLVAFAARRVWMQLRGGARPLDPQATRSADPKVIDGEFSVVRKPGATLLPR